MKIAISTIGRFHNFNQARQFQKRGELAAVFTGYPRFKLRDSGVEPRFIRSFPYLQTPYMALSRFPFFQGRLEREWAWAAHQAHDRHVARHLPECDIVIALSGMGLATGRTAQARGARYICDRGSTHKRFQNEILREEYALNGFVWAGIDPRSIAREVEEYAQADAIAVPSSFVRRTFLAHGLPPEKIILAPYGGDLSRFRPIAPKEPGFRVLFVGQLGLRKGLPYLLEAFRRADLPGARLVLVGGEQPETAALLRRFGDDRIERRGILHGDDLVREMSGAQVMVLPSIEEGLAMVMAEALACGTPVIATANTGAEDLLTDGVEGFIIPIRDPDAIAARLAFLAADRERREGMSRAARARIEALGGWDRYGETLHSAFETLLAAPGRRA